MIKRLKSVVPTGTKQMNQAHVSSSGDVVQCFTNFSTKPLRTWSALTRGILVWWPKCRKMLFRCVQILAFCAIPGRHQGHLDFPALTFGPILKGPKEDQHFKLVLTFTVAKCCSQLLPYFRNTYKVWAVLQTSISQCSYDHSTLTLCGAGRKGREPSYFALVANWRVSQKTNTRIYSWKINLEACASVTIS